jgi:hypothetical protein
MRRYDIVSGILLILSIIDFALAAPVFVQEKRQAWVDVMHIPKDVITVFGKRWEEDLKTLWEKYSRTWKTRSRLRQPRIRRRAQLHHQSPTMA